MSWITTIGSKLKGAAGVAGKVLRGAANICLLYTSDAADE